MIYRQGEQRIQREALTESVSARSAKYVATRIVKAEQKAMLHPGQRVPLKFSVSTGVGRRTRWLQHSYTVEYQP